MEIPIIESEKGISYLSPEFPPSVWGCSFASLPSHDVGFQAYTKEVKELKEEVKHMLMQSTVDVTTNIAFINLLCCLGVSYHFKSEIDDQLNRIFNSFKISNETNDYDLYTLSILFRVLRQHGYKMPCDVFKKFKDNDEEFSSNIANDAKGLLGLYEASFLCVHGENILDEAQEFTIKHLEILENSNPNLVKYIRKSLSSPFHHGIERIEALQYIHFYEEEEEKSHNETLLKFAKLDYNRLQLLYRDELALLSRWWKELNLVEKLPYARDRIVECYLWINASLSEPQYSFARIMGTKYVKMVSIVDDTYDAQGTLNELKLFTHALQRCTIDAIDELPNYMKILYKTMLDLFDETENHENEGIRFRTSYAKEMFKKLARSYLIEAKWIHDDKYVPSFDDYVKNALVTGAIDVICSGTMIGVEEIEKKDCDWMKSRPSISQATKLLGRMMNDIKPHEVEYKVRDCPIGLKSYMNKYGISEKEAIEGIQKMCVNAWKDINEGYMRPNDDISRIILKHFLNLARVTDLTYKSHDCYTYSSHLKDVIESLFIHQLPM